MADLKKKYSTLNDQVDIQEEDMEDDDIASGQDEEGSYEEMDENSSNQDDDYSEFSEFEAPNHVKEFFQNQ